MKRGPSRVLYEVWGEPPRSAYLQGKRLPVDAVVNSMKGKSAKLVRTASIETMVLEVEMKNGDRKMVTVQTVSRIGHEKPKFDQGEVT